MTSSSYLVVGTKPWNRRVFDEVISSYPGAWRYVDDRDALVTQVDEMQPRYVFFLHWSWLVPDDLVAAVECVCFHMTDVPFGRGGSPLQNLIVRGHHETRLTALRMTDEVDAGPVYLKAPLDLHGTAEEIYLRANSLAADMIASIIADEPTPVPQEGDPVRFARRKPADSEIPDLDTLDEVHDFIRMLDADGYPPAFLEHRGFRYRFSRAARYDGRIVADVEITRETES